MSMKNISKPILIAATAGVVASGVGAYAWHIQRRPQILEVYIFDMKSGRSMFIRTPDDQRILVDGGGNSQVIKHLTDIIPFYSRRINTIIVTSTDGKNVSGLIDVVDRYIVDKVYLPKFTLGSLGLASTTDKIYETFVETIKQKSVLIEDISAGEKLILGRGVSDLHLPKERQQKDVVASIIFPVEPGKFDYSKASPPEILFNIMYGNTSILFAGEASRKVQKFVASSSPVIIANVDALIVFHSAISGNMSNEFMNTIRPDFLIYKKSVTSQSANKSKSTSSKKKIIADPMAAILEDQRFNLKEIGTIKIISDGITIKVQKM
jgi:competence protein ComEC